ncbi:hypothetical protein ACFOD2_16395 [Clavibacter michiganensis subsp. insidiosus]|uniref:hypothetical protein n=1 Tax=Clavibacter michiganensis TaxID=28447 RepID=UPI00361EFF50
MGAAARTTYGAVLVACGRTKIISTSSVGDCHITTPLMPPTMFTSAPIEKQCLAVSTYLVAACIRLKALRTRADEASTGPAVHALPSSRPTIRIPGGRRFVARMSGRRLRGLGKDGDGAEGEAGDEEEHGLAPEADEGSAYGEHGVAFIWGGGAEEESVTGRRIDVRLDDQR